MFITIVCCYRCYGLKIFSSSEFCCISYSDLQTLIDIQHSSLIFSSSLLRLLYIFQTCYLTYCIKSPAAVATARLRGGPTYKKLLRRHWNNQKYGGSKLWLPHMKEFLWKVSTVWIHTFKKIHQPCPRPKKFNEYQF